MSVQHILSYGMGVESTAILLRWMEEPETCPCLLSDLIVITSQTGDEYLDTKRDGETHILPRMRKHGIRFVQVARRGEREEHGIAVLEDSRAPETLFTQGAYKLSQELQRAGTVPQFGGEHRCSLKFKAWVIESWLDQNIRGVARHAFGYNAEETSRIAKSEAAFEKRAAERIAFGFNVDEVSRIEKAAKYDTLTRTGFYPLQEWGWTRQDCLDYIFRVTGVVWQKSACVYCPFCKMDAGAIARHAAHPEQVADALVLEHMSLSLNPRGMLYKETSLVQLTTKSGNALALDQFNQTLDAEAWAIYRVRRIYAKKGKADRAVEKQLTFETRAEALAMLDQLVSDLSAERAEINGILYAYIERRSEESWPTREEFYVAAPARMETKSRYGIDHFDRRWYAPEQLQLA